MRQILALLAIGGLLLAAASDRVIRWFWTAHAMLKSIVGALLVIVLSGTVVDVIVRRRAESRWRAGCALVAERWLELNVRPETKTDSTLIAPAKQRPERERA